MKKILLLIIALLLCITLVQALPITLNEVRVAGEEVTNQQGLLLDLQRDQQSVPVRISLTPQENLSNIEVHAFLGGYEFNDRPQESISAFRYFSTLEQGVTKPVELSVGLPVALDRGAYTLYIVISAQGNREPLMAQYGIRISAPTKQVAVTSIMTTPSILSQGGGVVVLARLANLGERDLENVEGTITIPGLAEQKFFIDTLASGEYATSPDVFLRAACDAPVGTLPVKVTLTYNEGRDSVSKEGSIVVREAEFCQTTVDTAGQVVVAVEQAKAVAVQGGQSVFTFTITNTGKTSRSIALQSEAGQGVLASFIPSPVMIIQPGQSQIVSLNANIADDAVVEQRTVTVLVGSDSAPKESITFLLTIKEGKSNVVQGVVLGILAIAIIAVVAVLIVVLVRGRGYSLPSKSSKKTTTYY